MVPCVPQVPPRPMGAAQTSEGVPPSIDTVFSFPPAKKPRVWLSGDQKGKVAPSVPVSARDLAAALEMDIEQARSHLARAVAAGRLVRLAPGKYAGTSTLPEGLTVGLEGLLGLE